MDTAELVHTCFQNCIAGSSFFFAIQEKYRNIQTVWFEVVSISIMCWSRLNNVLSVRFKVNPVRNLIFLKKVAHLKKGSSTVIVY